MGEGHGEKENAPLCRGGEARGKGAKRAWGKGRRAWREEEAGMLCKEEAGMLCKEAR